MILGQGQDTPLGHGQQLCQISSRLDKCVRSCGPDKMWTDDRQTDGQSDKAIPIYPTNQLFELRPKNKVLHVPVLFKLH